VRVADIDHEEHGLPSSIERSGEAFTLLGRGRERATRGRYAAEVS
jgi:hypothetical protein